MLNLSSKRIPVLEIFRPLFSSSVWSNVTVLFFGTILARGTRTITAALKSFGLQKEKNFHKYHWVFSGAKWNALAASKLLLTHINRLLPFDQPMVIIFDETLEPKKKKKIKGLSRYLNSSQSRKNSKSFSFGLKWLIAAVSFQFPWSNRPWALPFLTHLTLPEKVLKSSRNESDKKRRTKHKPFTERTMTLMKIITKWISKGRRLIFVADSAFNTYAILNLARKLGVAFISVLRWDAALYDFPPKALNKRGRRRKRGDKQPSLQNRLHNSKQKWKKIVLKWYGGKKAEGEFITGTSIRHSWGYPYTPIRWIILKSPTGEFDPIALSCTDLEMNEQEIIETFVKRWNIEVTFEEVKSHLGLKGQRNWSDKSIERTTPSIMGLYSMINLMVFESRECEKLHPQSTGWYQKDFVTFSDVLFYVRQQIWRENFFHRLPFSTDHEKNKAEVLLDTMIYYMAGAS